ncbi:PGDYG domain-containing protein [Herbaspirillum seropedicae]|uniref:PGDYG domain-containing protein n=1 Tax=Herbaspirillum seropedicae TaxID=964 RepID=UPI003FCCCB53
MSGPDKTPDLSTWPGVRRVYKLPVPVEVRFAQAPGICQTLEGPVSYEAGDPVLRGVEGEYWTMPAARFDALYEPIAPTVQRQSGRYRKRKLPVLAVRLERHMEVRSSSGDSLRGAPGDWLLQYGPDEFGVIAPAIFSRTYRDY